MAGPEQFVITEFDCNHLATLILFREHAIAFSSSSFLDFRINSHRSKEQKNETSSVITKKLSFKGLREKRKKEFEREREKSKVHIIL